MAKGNNELTAGSPSPAYFFQPNGSIQKGCTMEQNRMLKLGQKWPDGNPAENVYWIGATATASVQHGDGLLLMGRECRSLRDLEMLADEIRAELDAVITEARKRLLPQELDPCERGEFQTRVVPMRSGR